MTDSEFAASIPATWAGLMELQAQMDKQWEEMHENPLVQEADLLRILYNLAQSAEGIPTEIWDEVWGDLREFGSCNAAPMLARVKTNEGYANAVLRVLHGLSAILQGYVQDRIDAAWKGTIESRSGMSKLAVQALVRTLKKRVPVVPEEIDMAKLEIYAGELAELKNDIRAEGLEPGVVWSAAVEIAEALLQNIVDDAIENGAKWVLKKIAKKVAGSAAGGAALLFLAEEVLYFLDALETIGGYEKSKAAYNRLLCKFVELVRPHRSFSPGDNRDAVTWNPHAPLAGGQIKVTVAMRGFTPERRGPAGAGEWEEMVLEASLPGEGEEGRRGLRGLFNREEGSGGGLRGLRRERETTLTIEIPEDGGSGQEEIEFDLPLRIRWPGKEAHYVVVALTLLNAQGDELDSTTVFAGAGSER